MNTQGLSFNSISFFALNFLPKNPINCKFIKSIVRKEKTKKDTSSRIHSCYLRGKPWIRSKQFFFGKGNETSPRQKLGESVKNIASDIL